MTYRFPAVWCRQLTHHSLRVFRSLLFALLPHTLCGAWLLWESHSVAYNCPPQNNHWCPCSGPGGKGNTTLLLSNNPKQGLEASNWSRENYSLMDSPNSLTLSWHSRLRETQRGISSWWHRVCRDPWWICDFKKFSKEGKLECVD